MSAFRALVLIGLCLTSVAYATNDGLASGYPKNDEIQHSSVGTAKRGPNMDKANIAKGSGKGHNENAIQAGDAAAMSNQLGYNAGGGKSDPSPGGIFKEDAPFTIRIAKNSGEPGETTVGRYLSIVDEYLFDWRDSETYRCNFHEGVDFAAIWEREPGQSPDTFYLRLKKNPRNGLAEHRYLAVLEYPPYQNDRRDQDSLWLVVHKMKEEAIEWRAVGSDSRSVYMHAIRNHSKTGGWTTGYSISARELLPNDKRDNRSTYAMVHSYMAAGLEIVQ